MVNLSNKIILELFGIGNNKKEEKEEQQEKYYSPVTKNEFNSVVATIKRIISKPEYKKMKKCIDFYSASNDSNKKYFESEKVKKDDYLFIAFVDLWKYPGFSRENNDQWVPEQNAIEKEINNAISAGLKVEIDGDWDGEFISLYSTKEK